MLPQQGKHSSFVQQLSICPAIHPSASVYSHAKIKPAEQILHAFVHTTVIFGSIFFLSVCWGVFTGYYYHPNYFFSFSAVSIQHFLFAFLIRLSVCFCLFSVAFQLLHLTRFGFFFSSTPCAYCLSYSLLYNST